MDQNYFAHVWYRIILRRLMRECALPRALRKQQVCWLPGTRTQVLSVPVQQKKKSQTTLEKYVEKHAFTFSIFRHFELGKKFSLANTIFTAH